MATESPKATERRMTVQIEKLVQGGYGLARENGRAIFVRGAIPGETVEVAVGQTRKQYQEAVVARVIQASPERVVPPCPVYGTCGGCQLQHLEYAGQLRLKRDMLVETLARVGKVELPEVPPIEPAPQPYGSRSLVRFTVCKQGKGLALGFHEEGSHRPVPVADCWVLPEVVRNLVAVLSDRLAGMTKPPCRIESIELRHSTTLGDTLLVIRCQAKAKRQAEALFTLTKGLPTVVGCVVTGAAEMRGARWVQGQDWIAERLDGMVVRISDRSFAQSNWAVNRALVDAVIDWAAPEVGLRVLECYAGIGTLGLPLAKRGAFVTLVEGSASALADARRAANGNHIGRCRFRAQSAESFVETVAPGEYDLVLVDPPRTGLTREVVEGLSKLAIPRVLYVSCDPATLARDLARFTEASYRVARMRAFDMFPQTAHVETLSELRLSPR